METCSNPLPVRYQERRTILEIVGFDSFRFLIERVEKSKKKKKNASEITFPLSPSKN